MFANGALKTVLRKLVWLFHMRDIKTTAICRLYAFLFVNLQSIKQLRGAAVLCRAKFAAYCLTRCDTAFAQHTDIPTYVCMYMHACNTYSPAYVCMYIYATFIYNMYREKRVVTLIQHTE